MPSPKKENAIAEVVNQGPQRLRPEEGRGRGGRGAPYCGRAGESCWKRPSLGYAKARRVIAVELPVSLYAGRKAAVEFRRTPATPFEQSILKDMHFSLSIFCCCLSLQEMINAWRCDLKTASAISDLNFGKLTTESTASSLNSLSSQHGCCYSMKLSLV